MMGKNTIIYDGEVTLRPAELKPYSTAYGLIIRHTGDSLGVPATGKHLRATGMSMSRMADGLVAKAWQNWDIYMAAS